MPVGIGKGDFSLDIAAPVATIRVVSGPSRPYAPLADGAVAWRAVSHLSVNYLSLVNSTPQEGAAALRDLLDLYAAGADASARKQIEGIRSVQVAPVVRRLPPSSTSQAKTSTLAFGRGLEIALDVDELAFEGGSAHLLGSVLARFFSRYVSINSFTETVLRSQSRGEINRWMPQWGARPTL
jgi:type VI secretion system protein ImpG